MNNSTIRRSIFSLLLGAAMALGGAASAAELHRADALVVVNSASAEYADFQQLVQPYLDHFGVPYTVLDIAAMEVGAEIENYAVIIVGHRQLDVGELYLDAAEQANITTAVSGGTGLVNFDNDLSADGSTPRYSFVDGIFGFGYGGSTSGSGVTIDGAAHYITERHDSGEVIGTGGMTLPGISLPAEMTGLASTGTQPFLAVTTHGSGRAVQWATYDWISHSVHGPLYKLDDLVWRSIVWAARKPFVMQGMPPFVTMRVDDESGPLGWIDIANEFGIKPWAGVFLDNIDATEAAHLSALVNAGDATASIHAFSYNGFFYYNHSGGDWPDETVEAYFAEGTQWHLDNKIPISKYVLGHFYELGSNVFQGLSDWGVEFVGTHMVPGNGYGTPWVMDGPFRRYESGASSAIVPGYYADFLSIPGHPEFDEKFFNSLTEIRDENGYEWAPNTNVPETIGHGTRQVRRALDSMVLAQLFTHGQYIAQIPAEPWREILQGITSNLESYNPIYVTLDYGLQYARAMHTSEIAGSTYDSSTNLLTVTFDGSTDISTMFYLFTEQGDTIVDFMVNVPTFSGSTSVNVSTTPGDPMPDVVGMTQTNAESAIVAGGYTVGTITTAYSESVAVDVVISQNPTGGVEVLAGSPVDLHVSLGPVPKVSVPDVVGQVQATAETNIVAAGLVAAVAYSFSETVSAGVVISQYPAGGSDAPIASSVDIKVSRGDVARFFDFNTDPNIASAWTEYSYYNAENGTPAWDGGDGALDLSTTGGNGSLGLYPTDATRAPTETVTMTVKSLSRTGGSWGFMGLMISAVPQPGYISTTDDSYTLRMQPLSATEFKVNVTRTYLDGTGNYELYTAPVLTFAGPYVLKIVRVGDHYQFLVDDIQIYTTALPAAGDFYDTAAKDSMVCYQIVVASDGAVTATVDDFGVIVPPFTGTVIMIK